MNAPLPRSFLLSFLLLLISSLLISSVIKGQDIIDRNGRYSQRYYFMKPNCNFDNLLEIELYSADRCLDSGQYQTYAECSDSSYTTISTICEHKCAKCFFERKFPNGCFNNDNGTSVLQTCGQLYYDIPYNGLFWNVKYETTTCASMYYSRVRRVGLCGTISNVVKPRLGLEACCFDKFIAVCNILLNDLI